MQRRGLLLAALASIALLAGCAKKPFAAASLAVTEEEKHLADDPPPDGVLSPAEQAEVLAAFHSLAEFAPPTDPEPIITTGRRWSDVDNAVADACGQEAVQVSVVRRIRSNDGNLLVYHLETIEDWPGRLVIHRVDRPIVYVAEAQFGRFPGDPKYRRRCDALLTALEKSMDAYGRKRGFRDEP